MNVWLRRSLQTLVLTGGFVALGTGIAQADDSGHAQDSKPKDAPALGVSDTSGNKSILGGNQVSIPINLPINVTGNAAAVGGEATAVEAGKDAGKHVEKGKKSPKVQHYSSSKDGGASGASAEGTTSGDNSVLGGNQVNLPISAPVTVMGNSIAALGGSATISDADSGKAGGADATGTTSGNQSLGGGNVVNIPVDAPVNVGGNGVGVLGEATPAPAKAAGDSAPTATGTTSGDQSVAGGNVVNAPIKLPVDVSGNAIGNATAISEGRSGSGSAPTAEGTTSGDQSLGGGNVVNAPVGSGVNVTGNAIALLGDATAISGSGGGVHTMKAQPKASEPVASGPSATGTTSGDGSVLGGNSVGAPISAPIDVCGNAVAVLGDATAGCTTGGGSSAPSTESTTSGDDSVAGGNSVSAPVNAPIKVCGNSVAVLGEATSECAGGDKAVPSTGGSTSGDDSVAGGNSVTAPVSAPVTVCGTAVAILGTATAECTTSGNPGPAPQQPAPGGGGSIGGGNVITLPISAPVDVCGNGVGVIGDANASCGTPNTPEPPVPPQPPVDQPPSVVDPVAPVLPPATPVGNPPVEAQPDQEQLPLTGSTTGLLAAIGGFLTMLGGGLALTGRRRMRRA